nr:phosphate acyltransferase [Idiomarina sp. UBA4206]
MANRLNTSGSFIKRLRDRHSTYITRNKKKTKLVFSEGTNSRILQAVSQLLAEDRIEAVLLGNPKKIFAKMDKIGTPHLKDMVEIINPLKHPEFDNFCLQFTKDRQRRGVTYNHAEDLMTHENYFGSMYVKKGYADAFIAGPTLSYPSCLVPVMNVIGTRNKRKAAGIFALNFKDRVLFLADCTAQVEPTAEDLAEIAISTAEMYRSLMKREPRVAFLSYSTYGSNRHPSASKVQKAVAITKERQPELKCDGELQADVAVNKGILDKLFPFTELDGPSDILIFPELNSANISYKLLSQLSDASAIGPILVPMAKTVNIIQRTAPVSEIVNMCILTALLHEERAAQK